MYCTMEFASSQSANPGAVSEAHFGRMRFIGTKTLMPNILRVFEPLSLLSRKISNVQLASRNWQVNGCESTFAKPIHARPSRRLSLAEPLAPQTAQGFMRFNHGCEQLDVQLA